jgi:bifunctional non-homologous end joining protein LigD
MSFSAKDVREEPLLERKELLKALLPHDPLLYYSEHVAEFGKQEFAKAQRSHEEGVIAKRAAGLYYSGKRTREWLKFKAVHEQEVGIVGYTEPRRSRKYFGSLVLTVRDKAKKRWDYAGHVGTGFDQAALKSLYEKMQPCGPRVCISIGLPEGNAVGRQRVAESLLKPRSTE